MKKLGYRLALYFRSFSARLFFLVVLSAILPLSIISFYTVLHLENFLRDSLSQNVFQNIQRSESHISESLQDLAYYSNVFVYDSGLREIMGDKDATQYQATKYFDEIIARSQIENQNELRADADVTLIDKWGRVLSTWSLNFNDYKFLLNEPWVKESIENAGHIVWSLFSPAYIVEKPGRYISLARSVLSEITSGEYVGTLIISIEQSMFEKILREYAYKGDQVYILLPGGELLMSSASHDALSEEALRKLYEEEKDSTQGNDIINENGRRFLLSYYTIPHPWVFNGEQMKVFHFSDYGQIENEVDSTISLLRISISIIVLIVLIISYKLARRVVRPITTLTDQLGKYHIGMKFEGLDPKRHDEIGQLHMGIIKMTARLENLFAKVREEHEAREHYYYESLRAQLNPHYIYNTLGTIRWMALARSADNIVEAIDNLATTLRYSMGKESIVTVRDEIAHIVSYVNIHNLRYDEYVNLYIDIPDDILNLRIMKFILQPIVENSIIHGFDRSRGMIDITISARIDGEKLLICILDDGIGISEEAVRAFEKREPLVAAKGKKLTGIGLGNVNEAIKLQYGTEYGIRISARRDARGTEALFTLPLEGDRK